MNDPHDAIEGLNSPGDDSRPEQSQDCKDLFPTNGGAAERVGIGCVALPFGLLAFWMAWIAQKFLTGNSWFEFIAKIVIGELVLGIGFIALTFLIWAIFAPAWIEGLFTFALKKTLKAIVVFSLLAIVPLIIAVSFGCVVSWWEILF